LSERQRVHTSRVADPDPTFLVGSGKFLPDPDSYLDPIGILAKVKLFKTRKKYFKNRALTHFQVNFSIFSDKIIII